MSSGEASEVDVSSFNYEHNSLIKMEGGSSVGSQTFQLMGSDNDLKFDFYF